MKRILLLAGGQIEIDEDDTVSIVSADGKVICFGPDGKFTHRESRDMESASIIRDFVLMSEEKRRIAKKWAKVTQATTGRQATFLALVKEAGDVVKEDYYIAGLEPSIGKDGQIYYKEGDKVAVGLSANEWKKKAQEFAPEYASDLATQYQMALWYAYRIAVGLWTISYVCDDSSSAGNYCNSPDSAHDFEVSGAREVGGAKDGTGNTYKIVADGAGGYRVFGGSYYGHGYSFPVAGDCRATCIDVADYYGSGIVVLKKICIN